MSRYTDWTSGEPIEKEWDVTDPALRALFDVYFEKHEDATDDEWCMKHLPRVEDVRAAYIAAAEAAPLDVERLARAIEKVLPAEDEGIVFKADYTAIEIAREYAAFRSPDTETAGDGT